MDDSNDYIIAITGVRDGAPTPLVMLKNDFSMEYGPHYTPDEAALVFWGAVAYTGQTLADRIVACEAAAAEWMELYKATQEKYEQADRDRERLATEVENLKRSRRTG